MPQIKCPQCGKTTTWENNEYRPFCSERCRMIDFGAWVDEEYRVPSEEAPMDAPRSRQSQDFHEDDL